jgi:hypothetical protein
MKDINYVIGRLQGLNELVKILKDLVDKKGSQNSDIIAVVTDHVSEQLDSILNEFDTLDVEPEHKEKLNALKEKHSESVRLRKPIIDESTVKENLPDKEDEDTDEDQAEESDDSEASDDESGEDSKETLDKHEKTVDDLLKDLESMKA